MPDWARRVGMKSPVGRAGDDAMGRVSVEGGEEGKGIVGEGGLGTDVLLDGLDKRICLEEGASNLLKIGIALRLVTVSSETGHCRKRELLAGILIDKIVQSHYRSLPPGYQILQRINTD